MRIKSIKHGYESFGMWNLPKQILAEGNLWSLIYQTWLWKEYLLPSPSQWQFIYQQECNDLGTKMHKHSPVSYSILISKYQPACATVGPKEATQPSPEVTLPFCVVVYLVFLYHELVLYPYETLEYQSTRPQKSSDKWDLEHIENQVTTTTMTHS